MTEQRTERITEEEVARYLREKCTHVSSEEFCVRTNRVIADYTPNHLRVSYDNRPNRSDKIAFAEKNLARTAISRGYEFVADLDYGEFVLIGTGWVRKIGE
jgi:hypothetical protein